VKRGESCTNVYPASEPPQVRMKKIEVERGRGREKKRKRERSLCKGI